MVIAFAGMLSSFGRAFPILRVGLYLGLGHVGTDYILLESWRSYWRWVYGCSYCVCISTYPSLMLSYLTDAMLNLLVIKATLSLLSTSTNVWH
jgi:hypothetical protein